MSGGAPEVTDQIYLWQLQRRDGVGFATTSHDQSVRVNGVHHDPSPASLHVEELLLTEEVTGSYLKAAGPLNSRAITSEDMVAGRWDRSSLELSVGRWQSPEMSSIPICKGELQSVVAEAAEFNSYVALTPPSLMEQPCPRTSPECRATLGDRFCRVDLRRRTRRAVILEIERERLRVDCLVDERFVLGSLRFLQGKNAGLDATITQVDDEWLVLRERPRFDVQVGAEVLLREGCDGRLVTCIDRFTNALNFRGEPHLPGTDHLTRYPGD